MSKKVKIVLSKKKAELLVRAVGDYKNKLALLEFHADYEEDMEEVTDLYDKVRSRVKEDRGWEFDSRHWSIATSVLEPGESISWSSHKPKEFNGEAVVKTLRKTAFGDITFLVENQEQTKVLTVGTIGT